ncbi:hypothetical protein, partial [Okeania hirsuta]
QNLNQFLAISFHNVQPLFFYTELKGFDIIRIFCSLPLKLILSLSLMGLIPQRLHGADVAGGVRISIDPILLTPDF